MEKHYCDHCGESLENSKYEFKIRPQGLVSQMFNKKFTIELCKNCKEEFKEFTGKRAKPKDDQFLPGLLLLTSSFCTSFVLVQN